MIRLGLRLAVAGGREAIVRMVIITVAVALGTGLLLATLAGMNAENAQNGRYAWLQSGNAASAAQTSSGTGDPVWWSGRYDYFNGHEIGRIDVAATGPHSPVPPGLPRLPGPGEYYASPALVTLLSAAPATQLADRYPGRLVGTIGRAGVPDPTALLVVVGRTPDQVAHIQQARRITGYATRVEGGRSAGLVLILSVVAAALLFPVLIFIGTATRLSTARREQRFAAMRLVGASPRQISFLATVESMAAAVTGTALGFALFFALHRPLSAIPFSDAPFYPSDMSLNLVDAVLVALGIPLGAAVATALALRRVRISPLGVTRRVTPKPPRAYRLIPLAAGVCELAYFINRRPQTSNGQAAAYLSGILLMMAGLIIAGPWLTMVGARVLANRSRRPATLIAARRLADNPKAAFRAVSGLVLALFVTSVAVGVITTIVAQRGQHTAGGASRSALSVMFWPQDNPGASTTVVPDRTLAALRSTSGVRDVLVVRANPAQRPDELPGLIACADLARVSDRGRCPAGATVASVWPGLYLPDELGQGPAPHQPGVWPAAPVSTAQLQTLPVISIVADTDGSTGALEQARTILEVAYPALLDVPATADDQGLHTAQVLSGWQQLANVVILATLPIAGCGLAVSVAGGLSERKRPFSLLRLSGVPLRLLRRVVALESAAPLLIAAAVAVGTGLLAAHLFLRSQMQYSLRPPDLAYYLVVSAGIVVSLGIIGSTLPMLERITGPETARNE
ncbi:MAG TPA: FtsX-like permease family protein [Rugosimonospora sp.]|nr:FtsX-like permease family protein [Rugosimonospora sp.]